MFFKDFEDMELWGATRRKFLKIVTLTGTLSAFGLFEPFKKIGFGKESDISPEEMRRKAMQLFHKPKLYQ
jgi:hypothetical protein